MNETRLTLHNRFQIGEVDPRIFGGFLEHMGRAVYQGVYQPDSRHADSEGCRKDVLAALARLEMPIVRYPGGNFVSAYHCFDEWNVWYRTMSSLGQKREASFAPPLIEEVYNLEDALVVAGFLNSFIRHADCVKIANLAQIANVIAPILTRGDDMLIQSIFYPFEMFSKRRRGVSLRCLVEGPRYRGQQNGEVDTIDCSAIADGPELKIFASNRDLSQDAELSVELADGGVRRLASAELVTGPDAKAANSYEEPDLICCQPFDAVKISRGKARLALPPLSILAMTLEVDR